MRLLVRRRTLALELSMGSRGRLRLRGSSLLRLYLRFRSLLHDLLLGRLLQGLRRLWRRFCRLLGLARHLRLGCGSRCAGRCLLLFSLRLCVGGCCSRGRGLRGCLFQLLPLKFGRRNACRGVYIGSTAGVSTWAEAQAGKRRRVAGLRCGLGSLYRRVYDAADNVTCDLDAFGAGRVLNRC